MAKKQLHSIAWFLVTVLRYTDRKNQYKKILLICLFLFKKFVLCVSKFFFSFNTVHLQSHSSSALHIAFWFWASVISFKKLQSHPSRLLSDKLFSPVILSACIHWVCLYLKNSLLWKIENNLRPNQIQQV
jgi:hypothetical protein